MTSRSLSAVLSSKPDSRSESPSQSRNSLDHQATSRATRWRASIDSYNLEDCPSFIQALRSVPARDICAATQIPRIISNMSIIDVLRQFERGETVIARRIPSSHDLEVHAEDVLWSRQNFVEVCFTSQRSFLDSVATIFSSVQPLPTVSDSDTLDNVFFTMLQYGVSEVGVVTQSGSIEGMIQFRDFFQYILAQVEEDLPNLEKKAQDKFLEVEEQDSLKTTKTLRGGAGILGGLEAIKSRYQTKEFGRVQHAAQQWVEAAWTELLILTLVSLDFSCTLVELTTNQSEDSIRSPLNVVTGCILLVYTFEASVRVYGYRLSLLWRILDLIDLIIICCSVTVFILVMSSQAGRRATTFTFARVLRCLRLIKIVRRLRKAILSSKTRYQKDGFNLDLAYITPTCIAMSLPAVGTEAIFANSLEEVQRFFYLKHPANHLIFNVCSERSYDARLFGNRVERIPTVNHNPPLLSQIVSFLEHSASYLEDDTNHVIAVHCKNGKGRTAVMVCAWLIYCKFSQNVNDAMEWFAWKRLRKSSLLQADEQILTPSQLRYLNYVQVMCENGQFETRRLVIESIAIFSCPRADLSGNCNLWFSIEECQNEVFNSAKAIGVRSMTQKHSITNFDGIKVAVAEDVRITFYDRDQASQTDRIIFYTCFHTAFAPGSKLEISKDFLDMACVDRSHAIFDVDFKISISFQQDRNESSVSVRKLRKISQQLQEIALKQRGVTSASSAVGVLNAITVDGAAVGEYNFGDAKLRMDEFSLAPFDNSLCVASDPKVSHETVRLFAFAGSTVPNHSQSKRLVSHYRGSEKEGIEISHLLTGAGLANRLRRTARHAVSGNKRRFVEDDFDLDLTYITPRLIAMGFPSKGMEGTYRNSSDEVYRFFQQRHSAHFRIINLCSERAYRLDLFHGSVARYPFPDHNPPPMELILPCCMHIHRFLQSDPDNVVAVHCKAGKGRTGLIIVAYLMFGGLARSARMARIYYDTTRTHDGKGLTIISQIRYVHYFEEQLRRIKAGEVHSYTETKSPAVLLKMVRFNSIPHFSRHGGCAPSFNVFVVNERDHEVYKIFSTKDKTKAEHIKPTAKRWEFFFPDEGLRAAGDVEFEFWDQDSFSNRRMMHFWVHTHFMSRPASEMSGKARQLSDEECREMKLDVKEGHNCWCLSLSKHEIDQAARDKKHVHFDEDFEVDVIFVELPGEKGTGQSLKDAEQTATGKGMKMRMHGNLYLERELYKKHCLEKCVIGETPTLFETWLLQNQQDTEIFGSQNIASELREDGEQGVDFSINGRFDTDSEVEQEPLNKRDLSMASFATREDDEDQGRTPTPNTPLAVCI